MPFSPPNPFCRWKTPKPVGSYTNVYVLVKVFVESFTVLSENVNGRIAIKLV